MSLERPRLLVVDDEESIRRSLSMLLDRLGYEVETAAGVDAALDSLHSQSFDLVLCDIDMPGRSGLELVEELATRNGNTAVVMVTGVDDPTTANVAIERGVYGYVIKPFERNEIVINIQNALRRHALETEIRTHRDHLEELVGARTAELRETLDDLEQAQSALRKSHEETIQHLAHAAEHKDPETGFHLQRMSRYSALLGRLAGLDEERCDLIRLASPMHDVGKIGIPDTVLYKTDKFDVSDIAVMHRHPEIGAHILGGSMSPLLCLAASIALTHHERYDGSGYPNGLSADEIPLEGRIVAIADVFDALTTARRYKEAWSLDQAREEMEEQRGRHFDPVLVDLFFTAEPEIEAIRERYSDAG